MVARHEVPGIAQKNETRPVGCGVKVYSWRADLLWPVEALPGQPTIIPYPTGRICIGVAFQALRARTSASSVESLLSRCPSGTQTASLDHLP